MIELRSDTFTLPTPAMLQAIAGAELGNYDYNEDPTVKRLEELAAARLGKERACLMPSGTMANLALIRAHWSPGPKRGDRRRSVGYLGIRTRGLFGISRCLVPSRAHAE